MENVFESVDPLYVARADVPGATVCELHDHPRVIRGKDAKTGEGYIECRCGADREYDDSIPGLTPGTGVGE